MTLPNRLQVSPIVDKLANIFAGPDFDFKVSAEVPRLQVNQFVGKLAFLYEKLRNALEYHEEHQLRRYAIERILKRRFRERASAQLIARPLIEELIRAKYLPNNILPETLVGQVELIIGKYIVLFNHLPSSAKARQELYHWLVNICSTEIEETLAPSVKDEMLLQLMHQAVSQRLVWQAGGLEADQQELYLSLAERRALLKADHAYLRFFLFNRLVPGWSKVSNLAEVKKIVEYLPQLKSYIERFLISPLSGQLARRLKPLAVYLWVLKDLLHKQATKFRQELLFKPQLLKAEIKRTCSQRYRRTRIVLHRAVIRSIIYVFFTKIILAFIVELPYDIFIVKAVNYLPLIINATFHPLLLLFLATATRLPTSQNTEKITRELLDIIYQQPPREKIIFQIKKSLRSRFSIRLLNIFYLLMYIISFGLIFWILRRLGFNILSGFLFVLFLSVVSFFAIRIRQSARDLVVLDKKENIFTWAFDFLTLPIIRAGRFISLKSQKINIFVFILDFIIEAPFKLLIEAFEEFTSFLKEKKEESLETSGHT